jgi:hypothetical protein
VHTRAGTAGGTLLVVALQISSQEMLKTVVLAALGAVVSFWVSHLLQRLVKKRTKKG